MTKNDIIDILGDGYTTEDIRVVIRQLKDDYEYDLRSSVTKDELLAQLEDVSKSDLIEVLDETYPDWAEEESEEDEEESDDEEEEEDEDEEEEDEV
jgi:hypothetical protein